MPLRTVTLDELTIDDRAAASGVAVYTRLETLVRRGGQRFRVPARGETLSWDRALFLNLTYWNAEEADVLPDDHIPADVVAHVGWHEVVRRALAPGAAAGAPPSAGALFLGESIASAFDLYLVGRLLPRAPESDFITTQVPILTECALEAGVSEAAFAAQLEDVVRDPERAFEDLRALLFDAATALYAAPGTAEAHAALEELDARRFAPLLHHYQLSNWILYARAYAGRGAAAQDGAALVADFALREAPDALDWLDRNMVEPALAALASSGT
jgi:hypothetical protein